MQLMRVGDRLIAVSPVRGWYCPTISMNLPSRGLLESATMMRYMGDFFRPTRRRRILTATELLLAEC